MGRKTFRGFEYESEGDSGFFLDSGEGWRGVRVRYRQPPTKRWSKFIIVHPASDAEIQAAILQHSDEAERKSA